MISNKRSARKDFCNELYKSIQRLRVSIVEDAIDKGERPRFYFILIIKIYFRAENIEHMRVQCKYS